MGFVSRDWQGNRPIITNFIRDGYNYIMNDQAVGSQLLCPQCGGELHVDEAVVFLICPHCQSTIYVDKSKVVFHWYLSPTINSEQARASLNRWMAGNETVKDLDNKASVQGEVFEFFPMWYFKQRSPAGYEKIVLYPAAAISITEIKRLKLLAGDLKNFDDSLSFQATPPTVPLETARDWLHREGISPDEIAEQAMVHVPLFTFKYIYQDVPYTALVEGATGQVYANIYPAKAETPYRFIGSLTAGIFLVLALLPLIGALINDTTGFFSGLGLCTGIGLLFVPLLLAISAWIAAKV